MAREKGEEDGKGSEKVERKRGVRAINGPAARRIGRQLEVVVVVTTASARPTGWPANLLPPSSKFSAGIWRPILNATAVLHLRPLPLYVRRQFTDHRGILGLSPASRTLMVLMQKRNTLAKPSDQSRACQDGRRKLSRASYWCSGMTSSIIVVVGGHERRTVSVIAYHQESTSSRRAFSASLGFHGTLPLRRPGGRSFTW